MKQIEVTIMGQSYLLGCPENGEAALMKAVHEVDREMCAIRDAGKVKARERIAVLSALNLAYALADRPTVAAPAPSASPASASAAEPGNVDVGALVERIDRVLGDDGRLL